MVSDCAVATRLSRAEQVERNRVLVLDAARRVFLTRGYAGATVDAIAEEAGFSKGVVYSQFAGKPDLFFALLEERIAYRQARHGDIAVDRAGLDGLREMARDVARLSAESQGWGRLVVEFRVEAARDPELNARYARLHQVTLDGLAEAIRHVLAKDGLTTVRPVREIAELLIYIDVGCQLEQPVGTSAIADITEFIQDIMTRLVEPI
jgi:AcrR family transcriptional regulator